MAYPLSQAHAAVADIQMLPPTNASGACPAGLNQVLIYSGNPTGGINCVPLPLNPATGNFMGDLVINEGWSPAQALEINSNQIWKSVTTGDSTLYLQYSNPGGAVEIEGSGAGNNLIVDGYLDVSPAGSVPTGYPSGWAGGIHTWDIYANGSIGVGDTSGNLSAYLTNGSGGQVYAANAVIVGNGASPSANTSCGVNGALSSDSTGKVYNCVSGIWRALGGGGGNLVLTESLSSGNNGGTSSVTSANPHVLCMVGYAGIWDSGHLYSFDIEISQNGNGTWTATDHSSRSTNINISCYDYQ